MDSIGSSIRQFICLYNRVDETPGTGLRAVQLISYNGSRAPSAKNAAPVGSRRGASAWSKALVQHVHSPAFLKSQPAGPDPYSGVMDTDTRRAGQNLLKFTRHVEISERDLGAGPRLGASGAGLVGLRYTHRHIPTAESICRFDRAHARPALRR